MKTTAESVEKKKIELTRCGACGEWQCDPAQYTEDEQNKAELIHCGCELEEQEQRYVTRDMAIDAGDRSLEGMPL
jgi:hypothetical protein